MNWIDKSSQADEYATIGNHKIISMLFADDLVLLSSTKSGLQRALNSFADAKTEILRLLRSVHVASKCSDTEASVKVQASSVCIYE